MKGNLHTSTTERGFNLRQYRSILILLTLTAFLIAGCGLTEESTLQAQGIASPTPEQSTDSPSEAELLETLQALEAKLNEIESQATEADPQTSQGNIPGAGNDSSTTRPETRAPAESDNGSVPGDIPIPGRNVEDLYSASNLVSYHTNYDIPSLTQYYFSEMQENNWIIEENGTFITESDALLHFQKPDKKVTINIQSNPVSDRYTVVITTLKR